MSPARTAISVRAALVSTQGGGILAKFLLGDGTTSLLPLTEKAVTALAEHVRTYPTKSIDQEDLNAQAIQAGNRPPGVTQADFDQVTSADYPVGDVILRPQGPTALLEFNTANGRPSTLQASYGALVAVTALANEILQLAPSRSPKGSA
ncbi:MAG: hypothetical protein WDO24_28980 [Pseudomonadota bacterium]